jgi:hypothetical protein
MLNINLKSHFICNFQFNYYQHADEILNGHQIIEIYWKLFGIIIVNDLKSDIDLILVLILMKDEICPCFNCRIYTGVQSINNVYAIVNKVENVLVNTYIFDLIDNGVYVVYALYSSI